MYRSVLKQYGFADGSYTALAFGTGLINHTWKIRHGSDEYILQQINDQIFRNPAAIDLNICLLAEYLKQHYPDYYFTEPVRSLSGQTLLESKDGYYRMFAFVQGSKTYAVVSDPTPAYEAARQFGKFTRLLSGFPVDALKITLPDFHNLVLRYDQFETARENGNPERIRHAASLIRQMAAHQPIVAFYEQILRDPDFKIRVTHHDTKISNVLFTQQDAGICVIDLDTVMPGYFISDVGDMMRTYLSAAGEEETDISQVSVRPDYYQAIVSGYLGEMQDELTVAERDAFLYAGKFMIYMQALRFLTDYLNNDQYYGSKYPLHNFNRAANQLVLLEDLIRKEKILTAMSSVKTAV